MMMASSRVVAVEVVRSDRECEYILKIGQSLLRGYMYGVKEEKEPRGRVQDFWLEHLGG